MSLMGSLYLGVSGLQTSNNALNTTAHNMSNLDTIGYTRQQVAQAARGYITVSKSQRTSWQQLGLGVVYSQTRQVRDYFLDKNYRRESGRSAFYEISSNAMEEIEGILGESYEGHEFSEAITNLWTAVEELSKNPTLAVNQNLFVTRSHEFVTKAAAVYDGLCEYQDNMNQIVVEDVDKINAYANMLEDLNRQIARVEGGVEHANDLRDQRNYILDELGKLGSISYTEDIGGYLSVRFEGVDLVKGGLINKMSLHEDPLTGFYTPYWEMFAHYDFDEFGNKYLTEDSLKSASVFDLTATISSDLNTDIGSLKSILLARGDHHATSQELKDVNHKGEYIPGWYDTNISQSIIMNIEAEFDQLINAVVTKVNSILQEAAERETANYPDSTYLRDSNGKPYQLFERIIDDGETYTLPDGTVVESGWHVGNLMVNMDLRQNPSLLVFRLHDSSEANVTMEQLKTAFSESIYTLNPNVQTPVCFVDYYKNLVSQVANSGAVFGDIVESQTLTMDSLCNAREQVVGVSSDEELTNMIMYQNAYNASSRYINVISEMLEHVITTLGR
ncbi:MAG: flagellar hook-associated protein FlgK [Blautia sp.]|nr:flagellar hook-associated protein FlgK [Lachnoclostridium sp.]MCM1210222.1 flagellar hook-associated protein FlgK [Blautia sp.]